MVFGIDALDVGSVIGGISTIVNTLIYVIVLGVIGVVAFYFFYVSQFKHTIIIKKIVNGRKLVGSDKFREITDKNGNVWYQLKRRRKNVPRPPSGAVEITAKGCMYVMAYETESGELIYGKDTADVKEVPKEIMDMEDGDKKSKALEDWRKKNKTIDSYQPLTTNQRLILINQIAKSQARRKTHWKDMILPITGIAALVIIIVALLAFWGEIAEPALQANKQAITMQELENEKLQLIRDLKYDIQTLDDKVSDIQKGGGNVPD